MPSLDQTLGETVDEWPPSRPLRARAKAPKAAVKLQHFAIARREDGSLHELGRGALGVTYKAFDTQLGSHVALKVINPTYLRDRGARERFLREARAAAHLNHPNLANVFHLGLDGDTVFYAMQFIEGETLETLVKRRGPLPVRLALRIIQQAARGLAAAHKRGLVHRDLKPANLMLTHAGGGHEGEEDDLLVKVIDFGLAKSLVTHDTAGAESDHASLAGMGPTGAPHFMSPEQIDGADAASIDARTDLYSLGVTLWYLLLGRPPFQGTQFQVLCQHMSKPPPLEQLAAAGVSKRVAALLGRMLAKAPADRPADYRELTGTLKRLLRADSGVENEAARETVALSAAGFRLVEVLRRRGSLPPRDAFLLLRPIAGLIDASPALLPAGKPLALAAENLRVEFAEPPANSRELPARSPEAWPPFTVALMARDAAAPGDLDGTLPPPPAASELAPRRGDLPLLSQLGVLAYELLNGRPPTRAWYVPITVLSEEGNYLLQQCMQGGGARVNFPSATGFVEALSETTVRAGVGGLALMRVPAADLPRPASLSALATMRAFEVVEVKETAPAAPSRRVAALALTAILVTSGYVFHRDVAGFVGNRFRAASAAMAARRAAADAIAPAPAQAAMGFGFAQTSRPPQRPPPPANASGPPQMRPPPPPPPGFGGQPGGHRR